MSGFDALLAAAILGAALWVIYRTVFRSKGRCAGCSGGCGRPEKPSGLVTLGEQPEGGCRPGAGAGTGH